MAVFKIFIVVTALLFCPSLGAGYNCTRRYQRLLKEAAVVKAQCPNAAFHDCCQVGGLQVGDFCVTQKFCKCDLNINTLIEVPSFHTTHPCRSRIFLFQ